MSNEETKSGDRPDREYEDGSIRPQWAAWAEAKIEALEHLRLSMIDELNVGGALCRELRKEKDQLQAALDGANKWVEYHAKNSIRCYGVGMKVTIVGAGVDGEVEQVLITRQGPLYTVRWWSAGGLLQRDTFGQEQLESKDANSYMPLRVEVEDV